MDMTIDNKEDVRKKQKAKNKFFKIEVGKQYVDAEKHETPKSLETWTLEKPISKECVETLNRCLSAARYIANELNEGPEVKDSVTKRTILLKYVLHEIIFSTFLNGYMRIGLLSEILNDIYMDAGGKTKILMMLSQLKTSIALKKAEEVKEKSGAYTA